MKKAVLPFRFFLLGILCISIFSFLWYLHNDRNRSDENIASFFVWSTGDCNGVYTISGMHTGNAIGAYDENTVYPVDALDNSDYFGLTYPFQIADTVYYTTTNAQTGENCIVAKIESESETTVGKRKHNWEYILSQSDNITDKRLVENRLYYIVKHGALDSNAVCEIRCFHMENKTDVQLISNVHPKASFDVDAEGNILYVNTENEVLLWNPNGTQENFETGTSACFWNNTHILKASDAGLYAISLDNHNKQKICRATGYQMELSPSSTYVALQDSTSSKPTIENDFIQIVDLHTGRIEKIEPAPKELFGIAWFQDYYPIC